MKNKEISKVIICKICKQKIKNVRSLSNHIKKNHNISIKKYYDSYLKKNDQEGTCPMYGHVPSCKHRTTFNGLSGYSKFCSSACSNASPETKLKKEESYLKSTGYKNPAKSLEIQKKFEDTNLRKTGYKNPSMIPAKHLQSIEHPKRSKPILIVPHCHDETKPFFCKICNEFVSSIKDHIKEVKHKCEICNKYFQSLGKHIFKKHHIYVKDYYDFYVKFQDEDICNMFGKVSECKKHTSFVSIYLGYNKNCTVKCSSKSEERNKKLRESWTEEKKIKIGKIIKEKWKNLSQEEKDNFSRKMSDSLKKVYQDIDRKTEITSKRKNNLIQKHSKKFDLDPEDPKTFGKIIFNITSKGVQEKYGVKTVFELPEIQELAKSRIKELYGVDNIGQSQEFHHDPIRKKSIKNIHEKYDHDFVIHEINYIQLEDRNYITCFLKLECKICGYIFNVNAHGVILILCPRCFPTNKRSKDEIEIANFITENLKIEIVENSKKIIKPFELDIYVPDLKIGIEYNGLYWHSDKNQDYHLNKTLMCERLGIRLIHIFEDEWIQNKKKLKTLLSKILKEDWDLLPDNDFESLSLDRRFCKSPEYYKNLGFKVDVIVPRIYFNKSKFKIWDCGFLTLKSSAFKVQKNK